MLEFIKNPPEIVQMLLVIFVAVMAIMWFILPFIVITINSRLGKALRQMRTLSEDMLVLEEAMEKSRKEGNISKLMAQNPDI